MVPPRRGLAGEVALLPLAEEVDEHVGLEALREQLGEEVQVGHERRLQDHRRVRRVEQLDRVPVAQQASWSPSYRDRRRFLGDLVRALGSLFPQGKALPEARPHLPRCRDAPGRKVAI